MAFPHPKSRSDKYRNEDEPSSGRVVWNFFKWTINISEYRNTEDEVNPAKNRAFGALLHFDAPVHDVVVMSNNIVEG
jgi:hypothetical protein